MTTSEHIFNSYEEMAEEAAALARMEAEGIDPKEVWRTYK